MTTPRQLRRYELRHKVTLPYPPAANRYWRMDGRHSRMHLSKEAELYRAAVAEAALLARAKPVSGEIRLTVHIFRPRRSGDLDGRLKQLLDSMQGLFYDDDKQIVEIHAYRHDDKNDGRAEVVVEEARD